MASRVGNAEGYAKREIPRIGGSSAAFIVIVVILIVVIAVSCSAVIYILREDLARNDPLARRQQYSRSTTPFGSIQNWFARTLRPNQRSEATRPDKSRSVIDSRQGWMHAGNSSDWDLDVAGEGLDARHPQAPLVAPSMRMTDRASVATPRSSNAGSPPGSSRIYSPTSDGGARGQSYDEHSSLSHQGITIESQLSSPVIRRVRSQEAILSSTDSFTPFSNHDSTENTSIANPFAETPPQSIRAFNSGSKFIEAL